MNSEFSTKLNETLSELQKEIDQLAFEDLSHVVQNLKNFATTKFKSHPYGSLATALGIGIGLGTMQSHHVKQGVIRIGKLIAMKSLSKMEEKTKEVDHESIAKTSAGQRI